jgi:hypothetical protein
VSGREIATVATQTARSIRRRIAGPSERPDRPVSPDGAGGPGAAPEYRADDARLDALRGELVHELDRLAAADQGCSAGFRRI